MNGTLPHWLERALGLLPSARGEGTSWTFDHQWWLAPWMTVLLVLGCAAFIFFCYARERGSLRRGTRLALVTIRCLLACLILLMLAQFTLSLKRTGLPYVVVMIDDSASMSLADHWDDAGLRAQLAARLEKAEIHSSENPTRLNLAKSVLLERNARVLREIDSRFKLKVYFVSGAARGQTGSVPQLSDALRKLEATGETSRLGLGVRSVLNDLRGTPPTAVVLLTDGIVNGGEALSEAGTYARRKGVPLFTVAIGSEQPMRDVELANLLVDEVVFVDDVVNFKFQLKSSGYAGKQVEVRLHEKGKPEVLARQNVTLGPDRETRDVTLPYRPRQVGEFDYVVEVDKLADEVQTENNSQQRHVSVRKEQIRVLLVQSYPNFEYRYLKHMLERDKTIKVSTVLQEADLEYSQIDQSALPGLPVRREEFFEYDVIVFGDVNPALVNASAVDSLHAFVEEKGGGLVFIAGPRFTPLAYRDSKLAELMPVDLASATIPAPGEAIEQGFTIEPTELGLASPPFQLGDSPEQSRQLWAGLAPVYWMLDAPRIKPGARVLAQHPVRKGPDGKNLPVILMQYLGAGKVLFHATDETWRWRGRVGDVLFARYWVQTIRYLSRSKLVGKDRAAELTADRRQYRRGEPVELRVRFADDRQAPAADDGVAVVVEHAGEPNRRVTLRRSAEGRGVFEGTLSGLGEGSHHAWIAVPALEGQAASVDFSVTAPPGEFQHVEADLAELRRASDISHGRFYTLATVDRLTKELPSGRQVPIEALPPLELWNRWWIFALFLVLIVTEWVVRKRNGLP